LARYRYLLIAFAINDIWFPLVHALTLPVICSYRDAFIMFSKGVLTSKVSYCSLIECEILVHFSICLFAAVFSQTMPIMAYLFIYRLIILRWFANCWWNYDSDSEMHAYVKPFLDSDFPGEGDGHIGALYYNDKGLRPSAVLTTMGFNGIMLFWFTIISLCALLIVRAFNFRSAVMSLQTIKLQKQMFRTLLLQ
ncbi:hypothetical protein PMAYCL1PPCAC_03851, partial [Pristionchus mayeri]